MTARHLLIAAFSMVVMLLLVAELFRWTEDRGTALRMLAAAGVVPVLIVGTLALSWQACRLAKFPPLFLFASPCPGCARTPAFYGLQTGDWPRTRLACPLCGSTFDLWMTRGVRPEHLDLDTPTYCLRWPEFVGRWRRIG